MKPETRKPETRKPETGPSLLPRLIALWLLPAFLCSLPATSHALTIDDISVEGFASLYYGQVLDGNELKKGAHQFLGYESRANFHEDSLYGVQLRTRMDDRVGATLQVVGKGRDDFDAKIAWAYATFHPDAHWTIKAGRQRVPAFYYSDSLDIGYSYHWVSPPDGVYDLGGLENVDGINVDYQYSLGNWHSTTSFLIGEADTQIENDTGIPVGLEMPNLYNVHWQLNHDWLTLYLVHARFLATFTAYNDILPGLERLLGSPLPPAIRDEISMVDDHAAFTGFAMAADWNSIFAIAEITRSAFPHTPNLTRRDAWYVTAGYRFRNCSLSASYEEFHNPLNPAAMAFLNTQVDPVLQAALISPDAFTAYQAYEIHQFINQVIRTGFRQKTYTVTGRYDFHPSASLKVEYRLEDADYMDGRGITVRNKPALLRIGIDMVF